MMHVAITYGPSKSDLVTALSVRKPQVIKVIFHLKDEDSMEVTILSLEAEDNSGESWNVSGYAHDKKFKAYYRTDKRIGTFELL